MHELAVTESILNITTRFARQENATRVTDVYLVIGDLSSIIDDSVQFYWDFITKDTVCEKSLLHFRRIPARAKCNNCGHEFQLKELMPCPQCDSARFKIIEGEEFYVDSIKITKEETTHVQ
ncbi:MAG: hydrogenase maturation nickel metallochaperone HypA [Anaerolineae bacterium]|nr:hydrogenase maturation nickel metallochaperone HypA [Anaerolineae bacterium]